MAPSLRATAAAGLLLALASTTPVSSSGDNFSVRRVSAGTSSPRAGLSLPAAEYSLPIAGSVPRSAHRKQLRDKLRKHWNPNPHPCEHHYSCFETAGSEVLWLTKTRCPGNFSSDTWFAETGFKCYDLTGSPEPASTCAFGSSGYNPAKSSTFSTYPNRNFNITYGDGEFLSGSVGFETLTVAGLTVPKQEIGVVNKAAWEGDGINTGLIGLCFPNLTSVYVGSNPDDDSNANNEPYNPYFFTAVKDGLVKEPYFSVALNRGSFAAEANATYDPNLGYIAFGGIAPVPVTSTSITSPVVGLQASDGATGYFFYVVTIDEYIFPGSKGLQTGSNTTILDTGTTLNYIPTDAAAAYAKAFKPAAYNSDEYEGYVVECDAQIPEFEVVVGGVTFSINGADQILPLDVTDKKGKALCLLGTQDGGAATDGNIFILGDVFLHNVVATFNIKDYEITLTQRAPY